MERRGTGRDEGKAKKNKTAKQREMRKGGLPCENYKLVGFIVVSHLYFHTTWESLGRSTGNTEQKISSHSSGSQNLKGYFRSKIHDKVTSFKDTAEKWCSRRNYPSEIALTLIGQFEKAILCFFCRAAARVSVLALILGNMLIHFFCRGLDEKIDIALLSLPWKWS